MSTNDDHDATGTLQRRRRAVLGPAYRHFYEEPLHPVAGQDVWLFDRDGRRYLDCYNNVPCVGHCHPHVVAALAQQAATLNTHTRYFHEGVVDYAERLAALFPPALATVMLTCSGSEANDLALRVAFAATARRGIIVTENAYHGVTLALADISPSLHPLGPHVRSVRAPNRYRAEAGTDIAARFAADVQQAIDELRAAGVEPAALIVDTVFASDGIFPDDHGALGAAARVIRQAGGLFIADEVQAGFGRSGRWWAFERDAALQSDQVPDMVSLGKPMGAGHPLAGLVLQAPLAKAFGEHRRYFNTFGGNTVSVAVGQAVLQVIEEEHLLQRAKEVGEHLAAGVRALAHTHPAVGDVRAGGLYLGVEIVADRDTRAPAGPAASRLVNLMRRDGVLISTCGIEANVLKIRPPLTFTRAHADMLVASLEGALRAL